MAVVSYKEKIDVFYGGVADDPRIQKPEVFQLTQHFDIWSKPKKLIPYRAMEADEDTSFKITNFEYINGTLYGAGRKSGGTKSKVYQKTANQTTASSWAAATTGEDTEDNSTGIYGFRHYHNFLYGGKTTGIWSYDLITNTFLSTTFGTGSVVGQGIITSDDLLIFPTSSGLAVKDGAGAGASANWSVPITFSNYNLTDLTEFGEYVANAVKPSSPGVGNSKVFLWDKVQSDPSHRIDWGEGDLKILENIEGVLIGISEVGGIGSDDASFRKKLVVRQYIAGNEAQVVFEVEADDTTLQIDGNWTKIREGSKVSFGLKIKKDGTTYYQMASVGRVNSKYPWAFSLDRLVDNGTAITAIDAAFKVGTTVFIAHNSDGSINRTDNAATYTTSTYYSQKLTGESRVQDAHRRLKKLIAAGVLTDPLTTGQSVSLYYRTDSASAWTLIRTYTYGDDATNEVVPVNMGFEAGQENDGSQFLNYRELEFKATAAGGASITGITYAWMFTGAQLATD